MAVVGKLSRSPLGEFTIKFSVKEGKFYVDNYPKEVVEKIGYKYTLLNDWEAVNKELDRIREDYLYKVMLLRRVIIIQIQTSSSDFMLMKKKWALIEDDNALESVMTEDKMEDAEGFELRWFIANEYQYPYNKLCYKITETNKNNTRRNFGKIDVLGQIISESNGEYRVLDYREDLHLFLKSLDIRIAEMLQQMIAYFDIDPKKFIDNFEKVKFKLLT